MSITTTTTSVMLVRLAVLVVLAALVCFGLINTKRLCTDIVMDSLSATRRRQSSSTTEDHHDRPDDNFYHQPTAIAASIKRFGLTPESCHSIGAAAETAFDEVYRTGKWGVRFEQQQEQQQHHDKEIATFYSNAVWPPRHRASASGPGSDRAGNRTTTSLRIVQDALVQYRVQSMMDIPCGDANWIFDSWITDSIPVYIGLDIVKPVIAMNQRRFQHHSNKVFQQWDGIQCPLPQYYYFEDDNDDNDNANATDVHALKNPHGSVTIKTRSVDLIHSRDVLQHLTLETAMQFLCNVLLTSGAKVFITTTYPRDNAINMNQNQDQNSTSSAFDNNNVTLGEWFANDLTLPPFSLPKINCTWTHPEHDGDQTCVYDLQQDWVQTWLQNHRQECSTVIVNNNNDHPISSTSTS